MASASPKARELCYCGYVYDNETELYYLQSRYYNPEQGRFINADALVSTGQGLLGNNMFAYCNNHPNNHADSSGYVPKKEIYPTCIEPPRPLPKEADVLAEWEEKGVKIIREGNNIKIKNSYMVRGTDITRFVVAMVNDSRYSDFFKGSIMGIIFEWELHNNIYYSGIGLIPSVRLKAADVDLGPTIYHDSHGFFSEAMWWEYELIYPESAAEDRQAKNAMESGD